MCLDRDGRRNCQGDAALVPRQVGSLLWRNWQDQIFGPIACNQKVLLSDNSQTHERELARVRRPPQSVECYIGKAISFRVPLGDIL